MNLCDLTSEIVHEGDLSSHSMIKLLGVLFASRKTGRLDLYPGSIRSSIFAFNGIPVYSETTSPGHSVLDVMVADSRLPVEDVLQVKQLAKEKSIDVVQCLQDILEVTESQIYYYRAKSAKEIIIKACGYRSGRYTFTDGEEVFLDLPMYDLNPLEIIYEGMARFHSYDLANEIFAVDQRKVKINQDVRDYFLLPDPLYKHSDVLDLFNREIGVGQAMQVMQNDLGDINQAINLMYLLLVTRLLVFMPEISEDEVFDEVPCLDADASLPPEMEETRKEGGPEQEKQKEEDEDIQDLRRPKPDVETGYVMTKPNSDRVDADPGENRGAPAEEKEAETDPGPGVAPRLRRMAQEIGEASDLFELLGLTISSDLDEINRAFIEKRNALEMDNQEGKSKELARELHDKLKFAHDVLARPEKRIEYERGLVAEERPHAYNAAIGKMLARKTAERGRWYMRHNAPLYARELYEVCIELDPEDPSFFMNLGWSIFRAGAKDSAEAKGYLKSAVKIDPELDRAHYYLGVIAKREGDVKEAEERFRLAIDVNPDNQSAKRELSFMNQDRKQKGVWSKIFGSKK